LRAGRRSCCSEVYRRGDDVVRGLAHVDVVVGVDRLPGAELAAPDLDRAVRDDLVGVHVRGGPGPGLEDVEDELVVQVALHDLLRRLDDVVPEALVQKPQLVVGVRSFELDRPQRLHEAARLAQVADREVVEGAPRLGAKQGVPWDLDHSHRVALYAVRGIVLGHGSSRRSSNVQGHIMLKPSA
jgi:hypothetical protein